MANDSDKFAPYAPATSVLTVIRRRRDRKLPEVLTASELTRLGIAEGNANRTLRALHFLRLVDEEGKCTPLFDRIGRASSNEYPALFGEVLNEAYRDVFDIIEPASATDVEINDAFRLYEPLNQRDRMIALFRALCQEAGIIAGGPPEVVKRPRTMTPSKLSPSLRSNGQRKPEPKVDNTFLAESSPASNQPVSQQMSNQDFALVQGLLTKLPPEKQWTQQERMKWLKAITATVDLLIEVTDPPVEDRSVEEMRF